MIENENVKKAEEELEYLTGDEEIKRLAFLREKAIMDERDAMYKAKKEGIKEGKIKIAVKMLKKGIDIESIVELTELEKEEIEKLK